MVNNSTNIKKTKQSLNSDGQQFNQYQHNDIGGIVDHHCFIFSVLLIFMEILTKTVLSLLCLVDIGGIVDHHC
jgi:inorganic pyrophosphatase/exopolyphosphatase